MCVTCIEFITHRKKGLRQGLKKGGFRCFLNFSVWANYLEVCGKQRFMGTRPKESDIVSMGGALESAFVKITIGNSVADDLRPYYDKHWFREAWGEAEKEEI